MHDACARVRSRSTRPFVMQSQGQSQNLGQGYRTTQTSVRHKMTLQQHARNTKGSLDRASLSAIRPHQRRWLVVGLSMATRAKRAALKGM